jgi:CHAD domain-containing protein
MNAEEKSARSTGRIIRGLLRDEVAAWQKYDPVARQGHDPEGVHQLRVGSRRLRAELKIVAPALREKPRRNLNDELGWIGGVLGRQRDLDVLHQLLSSLATDSPGSAASVLATLNRRRRAEAKQVRTALASPRYRRLVRRLDRAAQDPPVRAAASLPAIVVLLPGLRQTFTSLFQVMDEGGATPTNEQLHRIRIAVKRGRYCAEVSARFFGSPAKEIARELERVQGVLGDLHDRVVASSYLYQPGSRDDASATEAELTRMSAELASSIDDLSTQWREPLTRARELAVALFFETPTVDAHTGPARRSVSSNSPLAAK